MDKEFESKDLSEKELEDVSGGMTPEERRRRHLKRKLRRLRDAAAQQPAPNPSPYSDYVEEEGSTGPDDPDTEPATEEIAESE